MYITCARNIVQKEGSPNDRPHLTLSYTLRIIGESDNGSLRLSDLKYSTG